MRGSFIKVLALSALLALIAGCSSFIATGRGSSVSFERVDDGRMMGLEELVTDFSTARLIFIGELHDNTGHHNLQLDVIKAMHLSGGNVAIGLEMFRRESQPFLDRWVTGTLDLETFMQVYRDNWTIPWDAYATIFLYARNNGIPLVALNAPREIIQKVYRQGFAALSPDELRMLPQGISCSVDRPYMDFVRRNYVWHTSDESMFQNFCEAQLLRNKVMADRLAGYLMHNPERRVVVLTGVGHAMRRGVPNDLQGDSAREARVLLPRLHGLAAEPLRDGDADYIQR